MLYKTAIAVTAMVAVGTMASAQEITGGSLGIEYSAPTDLNNFGQTVYFGSLEYGINRNMSVAADISGYNFEGLSTDTNSFTLHGIYHMSDSASVGAFFGQDRANSSTADIYGIEGGTEISGGTVEGYLGKIDGPGADATIFGADGSYALQNGFSIIGGLNHAEIDGGLSAGRVSAGAAYDMAGGPQFYAEVGRMNGDDGVTSQSETYIGIGARVSFGAARGTTFGRRSIYEIVPNF